MSGKPHMLPVWFFVGVLLTFYGIVLLVTAIIGFSHPPHVVLARYHPDLIAGVVLSLIGGFYTLWFRPRKKREAKRSMVDLVAK